MSVSVEVPALGESITEAIIARWEVEEGDYVDADAPLVELETDKITVTVPSPVGGVLKEIRKATDDTVEVGEVIAVIEEGDKPASAGDGGGKADATPAPDGGNGKSEPPTDATTSVPQSSALSPSVKRLVTEHGIDPSTIEATGPRGRITKGDVLAHVDKKPASKTSSTPARAESPAGQLDVPQTEEVVPMSSLRRRVAERLVQAQQTAAILTTFNEADMSAIMALRKQYKDRFLDRYGIKLGFMSFFVKACIEALKAHPAVNAEIRGTDIVYKNYYHVGVAVGGGKGLVVPVIRNADRLSFAEVELEIGRLAGKAKKNTLSLDDLTGGTFTISNGGVYGSMMSTPILNPPQVGILGMHNIVERAVVVDGQVVVRPMMYLALSYDHRIIDGREAVQFLVRIKECVENPERILLEV